MAGVSPTGSNDFISVLERQIYESISRQLEEVREKVIANAEAEFRVKVRECVGKVTVQLSDYFSVERHGMDIIIHAKISDGKHKEL